MTISLHLYNTLSREKELFTPIDPSNIRMYVCGPTVYDHAHIGNARPVVVFDLLFRLLRLCYSENSVTYVRNITDVDDKILLRATQENISIKELTEKTTALFHQDTDSLGVLRPTHEPRATAYIPHMITMIESLIAQNHAYVADGHVLFDTLSMPDYGKLSKRNLDDMIAGARVEVAPYKKNATDFVLWKPSDSEQMGWESTWGYGRPGWHIECSAMSGHLLGKHFDIHGGGIDLTFPHHENELAQSTCTHHTPYVNIWMHNGFLQINGQKMSKSLGNFLTIHQLLHEKKISGNVIRLLLLRTHYRQPLDFTDSGLEECQTILNKWFKKIEGITAVPMLPDNVLDALSDDLNMPLAITHMHALPADLLANCLCFLGFKPEEKTHLITAQEIEDLIEQRKQAKAQKDFAKSDEIRDYLQSQSVMIKDTHKGTFWEYQ